MSDSQEKTFGELLSEGIGKMKTDLAAALAANQRLEKEWDEANAFIRLQESEFQDKWKCLTAAVGKAYEYLDRIHKGDPVPADMLANNAKACLKPFLPLDEPSKPS